MTPRIRRLLGLFTALVCLFSVAPVVVIVLESFTATQNVVFPPRGLSLQWYVEFLRRPEFVNSAIVSLVVALCSCLIATTLGTMIALALARQSSASGRILQSIFMAPLSLPGIILGLGLLQLFAGWGIPRNVATMIFTHVVITLPFAIRFVSIAVLGIDRDAERAAQSLGADPWMTFRKITVPLIRPGIIASLVFAFILSFDELAASLFISSPAATNLPVRIFVYIEQNYDPLITSVSSILVFAAIVVLIVIERTIGMGRLFGLRTRSV